MLRRPPTVLTLTSEDVKAYEDRQEVEAFKEITMTAAAAAHHHNHQHHQHRGAPQHNQLTRSMSGMDITGITTSSSEGEYDDNSVVEHIGEAEYEVEGEEVEEQGEVYDEEEDEANQSYVPNRYMNMRHVRERARWRGLAPAQGGGPAENNDVEGGGQDEEVEGQGIYLNEDDPFTVGSNNNNNNNSVEAGALSERHVISGAEEDEDMVDVEEHAASHPPQPPHHRQPRHLHHPEPPPAPSRITTRSTRAGSREPTSAQTASSTTTTTTARYTGGGAASRATAAQTSSHRRAHSGRSTTTATAMGQHHEAVTPTPVITSQAQRGAGRSAAGAFVTPEARVTRSRDERIGVGARGAGRR